MGFKFKTIVFILLFSFVFYYFTKNPIFSQHVLLADLGGIPWLYSTIGMLFSILAGFVIQKEWDNWNNLVDSIHGEVDTLRELWLWSKQFPDDFKKVFQQSIRDYLTFMSNDGLILSQHGTKSEKIEEALSTLHDTMFEAFKKFPDLSSTTFVMFTKLLEYRTRRIRYSSHRVPRVLKNSILLITILMISLSLFIGIKNIYLYYVYTMSVSFISFIIYLVIDDLNNPLRPGGWHVTNESYVDLLKKIS